MKKKIYVLSTSTGVVNAYSYVEQAYIDRGKLLSNGSHDVKVESFEIEV